jgi:hypothetical protein
MEEHPTAAALDDDDDGGSFRLFRLTVKPELPEDIVLIDLPVQRPESYAFSVPITSIYSLIVQPPTLSSWCMSASLGKPF